MKKLTLKQKINKVNEILKKKEIKLTADLWDEMVLDSFLTYNKQY